MARLRSDRGSSNGLQKAGIAIGCLMLIGFFLIRGFPYDALAERITAQLARSGVRVQMAELGPAFQLAGPALEATGVRVSLSDGQTFQFDRTLVRAAWSTSWFSLVPAVHVELDGPLGHVDGVLEWSATPAWTGRVTGLDLKQFPLSGRLPGVDIDGLMDATVDLRFAQQGPEGPAKFEVRDGSLSLPNSPIPLPFERLTGDLSFGGDAYVSIASLELSGPLASASGGGTIGKAASFERAPLRIEISLEVKPAFAGPVRAAGLRVDPSGAVNLRVTGTVSNPKIR